MKPGTVLVPICIFMVIGCASAPTPLSPVRQTTVSTDSYNATLSTLTTAGRNGLVTKEFLRSQVEPVRALVASYLDKMQAAATAGSMSDFADAYNRWAEEYGRLLVFREQLLQVRPAQSPLTSIPMTPVPLPSAIPAPAPAPAVETPPLPQVPPPPSAPAPSPPPEVLEVPEQIPPPMVE